MNELGINDYNQNLAASSYSTLLAAMWDAIHTALPSASCWQCNCFLYSTKESTPNGAGSYPSDFRTAQSDVVAARSSWLSLIDTYSMCTDPPDFLTDHLHLTAAGAIIAEAGIRSAINAGGGWY